MPHHSSPLFSLCLDLARHGGKKIYLFIITAESQLWLSTQDPRGGDWVPDFFFFLLKATPVDLRAI